MKRISITALLVLAACTPSPSPQQVQFLHELADRPVTCSGKEDCNAKWSRATEWVLKHTQTGIKSLTKKLIATRDVTDGSRPANKYAEFTVVRYPHGDEEIIAFSTACDYGFACNPSGLQLKAWFVTYVMGPPPGATMHEDGAGASKPIAQ